MDILADEPTGVEPKQCRTCGAWLPATTEYFARDKKGKDGLLYRCKSCSQKAGRQYKKEHKNDVAAYQRVYQQGRSEELAEYKRAWREKNKKQIARYKRAWREEHHEHIKLDRRRYTLENPEKAILRGHRRRSAMLGARGRFTKDDLAELYELQHGRCCWCAQKMVNRLTNNDVPRNEKFAIDHLNPVSRGGSNWWWNIVLVCQSCNSSKSDKRVFSEWRPPSMLTWMEEHIVLATALEVQWVLCLWKLRSGVVG